MGGTTRMRSGRAAIGIAFLAGNAFAQTAGSYVNPDIGPLLPPTFDAEKSTLMQTETLGFGKSYGNAYGYDFVIAAFVEALDLAESQAKNAGLRGEHEHILEGVQERLDENPQVTPQRRETVEHPFCTIKAPMGATHFFDEDTSARRQRDGATMCSPTI